MFVSVLRRLSWRRAARRREYRRKLVNLRLIPETARPWGSA